MNTLTDFCLEVGLSYPWGAAISPVIQAHTLQCCAASLAGCSMAITQRSLCDGSMPCLEQV